MGQGLWSKYVLSLLLSFSIFSQSSCKHRDQNREVITPAADGQGPGGEEELSDRDSVFQNFMDVDLGQADYLETKLCLGQVCSGGLLTDDSGEIELQDGSTQLEARACSKHSEVVQCSEWVKAPVESGALSEGGEGSEEGQTSTVLILTAGASAGAVGAGVTVVTISKIYNYQYIKDELHKGELVSHDVIENYEAKATQYQSRMNEQEKFIFGYDLDDTLTEVAYRGKARINGTTQLKVGMADMLRAHISRGDAVVVVTANVRPDVETFLMEKLGFDPGKPQDVLMFRDHIIIKQPNLPDQAHFIQPLKADKGKMFVEAIDSLQEKGLERGYSYAGAFFSDDKPGFIKEVLQKVSKKLPIIGLRVGYRSHIYQDPIDAIKNRSSYEKASAGNGRINSAGASTEFARMTKHLSEGDRGLAYALLDQAKARGNSFMLASDQLKALNSKFNSAALDGNVNLRQVFDQEKFQKLYKGWQVEFLPTYKPPTFQPWQSRKWTPEIKASQIKVPQPTAVPRVKFK